jgi:hypothetical protein
MPALMFPGRPPSRPRNTKGLNRDLKKNGLPTLAARNSAMIANIVDLEPVVVSDLFGVAPQTAHRWDQHAQASWSTYLAARSADTRPQGPLNLVVPSEFVMPRPATENCTDNLKDEVSSFEARHRFCPA